MNKDLVIERYKNPKHFSESISGYTGESINSSCGDEIYVGIEVKDGRVIDCKYKGSGCSICLATTDLLVDEIMNKEVGFIKTMSEDQVLTLIHMESNSPRKRCATLSIEAVKNSVNKVQ